MMLNAHATLSQNWPIVNSVLDALTLSPRNFAFLRRVALNALNQESTYRRSMAQKIKREAMDNNYMMPVLRTFCQA